MQEVLCLKCAKHEALKKYILENGEEGKCSICDDLNKFTVNVTEDTRIGNLFRALVRYYYSEDEYNGHLGGDGIYSLFHRDNPILNYDAKLDEYDLRSEGVIWQLTEPCYSNYKEGVSLYSGYDNDGFQLKPLVRIIDSNSFYLKKIRRRLKEDNYFIVEKDVRRFISKSLNKISQELQKGSLFYRARIGFEKILYKEVEWIRYEKYYVPYRKSDISSPPPLNANAGRLNRQGVSFLYLASDSDTAISEVRPHPGHFVSLGKFYLRSKISIVDFSKADIYDFFDSDQQLDIYHCLICLDKIFSMPITPEQAHEYSITQLITDLILKKGFNGVKYRSSVGSGFNFTCFYPKKFKYIIDEASVHSVKSLNYDTYALLNEADDKEIEKLIDFSTFKR